MYTEEKAVLVPHRDTDAIKYGRCVLVTGFVLYTPEPDSIPDLPQEYLTFPSYPCFVVENKEGHKSYIPLDSVSAGHWTVSPVTDTVKAELGL